MKQSNFLSAPPPAQFRVETNSASVLVATGLLAALSIQNYALFRLKIDSPLYECIGKQKDFVADILPPPLSVAEP